METNFNEIKQEILQRAKKAGACKSEYARVYAVETLSELSQVIKDNFHWVCFHDVLTVDLIDKYKEDFAASDIYANQDVNRGYLICRNATVKVYGNAKVEAYGYSKVEAYENSKIEAYNYTNVEAYDYTNVKAYCDITVQAYNYAKVIAYGHTKIMAYDSAMVTAYHNVMVEAYDTSLITVRDNAHCTSPYAINCKLSDHAIYCDQGTNTIYYADSDIKFVKL